MYTRIYIYFSLSLFLSLYIYIYVRTYVRMYVYVCVYIYIYIYMRAMHTLSNINISTQFATFGPLRANKYINTQINR